MIGYGSVQTTCSSYNHIINWQFSIDMIQLSIKIIRDISIMICVIHLSYHNLSRINYDYVFLMLIWHLNLYINQHNYNFVKPKSNIFADTIIILCINIS